MKQRIRHLIYFILLVAIDQISKYWAITRLKGQSPITIIPGALQLRYHENTGAVWGILSGKIGFLSILTIILIVILILIYFKIPNTKRHLPIQIIWVFILSGATGNFIDRVYLKYVVDFIYIELIDFPIFNIADNYLTISCVILLILGIFYYKEEDFEFIDNIFKKTKKEIDNNDGNQ